ncbi:MAG TPA: Rieske (2Fe-2S) protein [Ktedonobacterales bacterium]|nr:Rieske (2Fe-2S) protein [Ktedonobacterales bacterium]
MNAWENHRSPSPEEYPEPESLSEQQAEASQAEQLNTHIERLRAGQRPSAPVLSSADEAGAYGMSALFRAATPGAAAPDSAFLDRLLAQVASTAPAPTTQSASPHDAASPTTSARQTDAEDLPIPLRLPTSAPRSRRRTSSNSNNNGGSVSRRGLLAGGLSAAAAAVVGGAAGAAIERASMGKAPVQHPTTQLVTKGKGVWVAVAPVSEIPVGKVYHFQTKYIVGFIRHTAQGFSALSGVCTHMSCLLNWNRAARTFDCPCHGGRFTEDGQAAPSSPVSYSPLPAIETKVEQDKVWVYVLPPNASGNYTTGDAAPTPTLTQSYQHDAGDK